MDSPTRCEVTQTSAFRLDENFKLPKLHPLLGFLFEGYIRMVYILIDFPSTVFDNP